MNTDRPDIRRPPARLADLAERFFQEMQRLGLSTSEVRRVGLMIICLTPSISTAPEENPDGQHHAQLR